MGSPGDIGTRARVKQLHISHAAASKIMAEAKAESTYSNSTIKCYLNSGVYPGGATKQEKHGLRKRSRFFIEDAGHLHYVGGKVKKKPRLVVESGDEQVKLIKTIHEAAHLGRDKILSQLNDRYYWPEMYKQVCAYVSLN